ncbi:MAG: hypothetical protein ACRDRE_22175, partial [Pseudonocardiaceae bacterium]
SKSASTRASCSSPGLAALILGTLHHFQRTPRRTRHLGIGHLDEMDLDEAEPRRAASVIRAVNYPSACGVRPVVVTCRTSRYQRLSERFESTGKVPPAEQQTTSTAGRREVVEDATVVSVQPLTAQSVADYLTHRFQGSEDRSQWRPIVERLTGSNGGGDPLAVALRSPLRLFLIVTVYRHCTSTLAKLTELATAAQINEYLFDRLVPAVLAQHSPPGRQYSALEVTRWLTTLARHLARQGKLGAPPSDLRLDLLWRAAGRRAPRYAVTAATTTAAGALLAAGASAKWPPDVLPVLGLGTLIVVTAWIALRSEVDLRRLDLSSLRTPTGRKRIVRLLAVGLSAGLLGGLMLAMVAPMSIAARFVGMPMVTLQCGALGLVGGLLVGLGSGPTTRPAGIDRPARLVQQGMAHTIAAIVAVTLTFLLAVTLIGRGLSAEVVGQLVAGLGTWLAIGLAIGPARGPAVGLAAGLAVGLNSSPDIVTLPFAVVALVVGLIFVANSPWPRYRGDYGAHLHQLCQPGPAGGR